MKNLNDQLERIKLLFEYKIGELMTEQTSTGRCDQWKNGTFKQGDGKTTPKITITKTPTLIEGLYEGPDNGGCIQRSKFNDQDTPHQLAGITIFHEAAPYLKELYGQGVYVKPDKKNIKLERVPNKSFKISIPLIPTTEDQAITSINERGGMGHEGDLTEIDNIENNPDHILVDKVRVKSVDMTETIIWFRNKTKFPVLTKSSTNNKSEKIEFKSSDLSKFLKDIEEKTLNKSVDLNSLKFDIENKEFSIDLGNTQILKFKLTFNTVEDKKMGKFPSRDNVIIKNTSHNPTIEDNGTFENDTRDYALIVLYP